MNDASSSLVAWQEAMKCTSVKMVMIWNRFPSKPEDPVSLKDVTPEDMEFKMSEKHSTHLNSHFRRKKGRKQAMKKGRVRADARTSVD